MPNRGMMTAVESAEVIDETALIAMLEGDPQS
jgi:hypothetical protein